MINKTIRILLLAALTVITMPVSALEDARNFDAVLANLIAEGDQLAQRYSPSQSLPVSDGFSRLYFDQFESSGLEFRLATQEADLTAKIELGFTGLIQASLRSAESSTILGQWEALKSNLQRIDTTALNSESWMGNFVQSLLILLREGVEAILLVALLVTLLTRSGHGDKIPLIWYGASSALLASVALAYGLQALIGQISTIGQTREMIEGLVLLTAAALLCYVSFWLLSQKESQHWQQFLMQHIEQELARSNQVAVFLMAFVAVFREGAETILFYQALMIESQSFDQALWAGAVTAALLLIGFYLGLNRIVRTIRLDYFFKATAGLLFIMAVVFTGKGVMELQASGSLPVTAIDGMVMSPMLGVFPTVEGLSVQLLILFSFAALVYSHKKMRDKEKYLALHNKSS